MISNFITTHHNKLKNIALGVRLLSQDTILNAKSGHTGLPLGCAEIGTFLYFACMNYDNKNPNWFDRDRFILSAGHGSALQYSLMHFAQFGLSTNDLKNFRQLNSLTPGHPEYGHTPGIEMTTGPLGQGLASAVGMALSERMLAARINTEEKTAIDHYTYVIAGDGCMMEGVTSEACSFAGHLRLSKLIVLYDANNITIDGTIDITFTEDVAKRFESYGWNVFHADGHDFMSLASAMDSAHKVAKEPNGQGAPSLIICKTIAGKGSPKWEGKPKIHGNPMTLDDVHDAKKHLGIDSLESFYAPQESYNAASDLLKYRVEKSQNSYQEVWTSFINQGQDILKFTDENLQNSKGDMATRVSSGKALTLLAEKSPYLVGGSADLAGSNNTTLPNSSFITADDFNGRNIHFGVREHAMGAICNGITLHGGLRAYCATFAVFSDYMRPAIRMAAIMNLPTLFIFTHDSFAVGEDGPTHQPIEHHLALRSIPNLDVYRPADGLETFLSWESAFNQTQKPSCFLLTRQNLKDLHFENVSQVREGIKKGAYILKNWVEVQENENSEYKKIVLFSSGSEVNITLEAADMLEKHQSHKLSVRVISIPNINALLKNKKLLDDLLPLDATLIGLDAGLSENLSSVCGRNGVVFGLNYFGLSAPYPVLAKHFGFTAEQFAEFVMQTVHKNEQSN